MFRAVGLAAVLVLALPAATKVALVTAPEAHPLTAHDWLGVWRDGQNVVWISQNPDELVTVVSAAYATAANAGGPMHGTLQFEAALKGDRIRYADDVAPCAADMLNYGGQLIVQDNGNCGPVRFNGVYTHQ
ncbi:MAG TPA: hypothetical protein VHA07_07865 [Devosia sp.]|nr:hypothetical protein [Devosia sp.]